MTWSVDLVKVLRYYINDIDVPQSFTDENLRIFILIGISQLQTSLQGIDIGGPYTIDFDAATISPDPCSQVTDDNTAFLNLIVLAAACILIRADLNKKSARFGFRITDDRSTIDAKDMLSIMKDQSKEFCKSYEAGLSEFKKTKGRGCKFILSPFSRGPTHWGGV